ncbi:MAG: hypothetical protein ACD_43C00252G0001, partial [uncultured bacterium]
QLLVGLGVEQTDSAATRGIYLFNGSTWTHLSAATTDATYTALITDLVYDNDTNTMFAVSSGADIDGEVFKTTDAGSWENWLIMAANDISSGFWGQSIVVNTQNTDQIFVSTARPAGTGYIYSCSVRADTCEVYYQGLKDEIFNTMIFDGLVTGSNTGIYSYQSKAKLHLTKQTKQRRIVIELTDKSTNQTLNNRTIRLYRKFKTAGTFKLIDRIKIKHGQATYTVNARGGIFQGRWRASKDDVGVYAAQTTSKNVRFVSQL